MLCLFLLAVFHVKVVIADAALQANGSLQATFTSVVGTQAVQAIAAFTVVEEALQAITVEAL